MVTALTSAKWDLKVGPKTLLNYPNKAVIIFSSNRKIELNKFQNGNFYLRRVWIEQESNH